MKKLITIIGFCLAITRLYGQDVQMHVNGTKVSYEISTTKMFVKTAGLDTNGATRIELTSVELNTTKENIWNLQKEFEMQTDVVYASPVLVDDAGKEIGGFTNQVFVRLKFIGDSLLLNNDSKKLLTDFC